jgi:hypothetical protein
VNENASTQTESSNLTLPPGEAETVDPRKGIDLARQRRAVVLGVLIAVIAGAASISALAFNSLARIVPLSVALLTTVLAIVQVLRESRGLVRARAAAGTVTREAATSEGSSVDGVAETNGADVSTEHSIASAFAWVLLLGAAVLTLGMMLAIPIFCGLFMRLYSKERWRTILITVVFLELVHYLVFFEFLNGQEYSGWIGFPPEGLS